MLQVLRKLVRFLLWSAVLVGALVALARFTAIRWWRIPERDAFLASSIGPSLRAGDMVLSWRATLPGFGDLVLCPEPGAPGRVVIGRLVGEAGDKVEVAGDQVKVNGRAAESESACPDFETQDPNTAEPLTQHCDVEVLGGRRHFRGLATGQKVTPAPVTLTVEPGQVFLLSDNRLYPYDSRDFGPVDRSTCTETIFFRLFGRAGLADRPTRLSLVR